jgi:hypothetical protein
MGFNEICTCSKSSSYAGRISLFIKINSYCFILLVWDACSESLIAFDQSEEDSLAYIVENDVIQSCLLERLKQFHIEPRLNSKVKQFEHEKNSIQVKLQDEKINLQTRLLVYIISYETHY